MTEINIDNKRIDWARKFQETNRDKDIGVVMATTQAWIMDIEVKLVWHKIMNWIFVSAIVVLFLVK